MFFRKVPGIDNRVICVPLTFIPSRAVIEVVRAADARRVPEPVPKPVAARPLAFKVPLKGRP